MAKFCPNCGKELDNNAVFCPQCGTSFQSSNSISSNEKKSNGMATAGFILSFFFTLLGLIFSIIGLKKSKETNSGQGLSIAGIIISSLKMAIGLVLGIMMLVTVPTTVNTIEIAKQRAYCLSAYNCRPRTDGRYNCIYKDAEGKGQQIICDENYNNNLNDYQ